jgi:tyrosine-protein kinase Etk/Wzc
VIQAPKSIIVNKGFYPHILRNIIRRYWFVPVLTLGIFYIIGFFYLRYTKAVYESNSVIQIADVDQSKEIIGIENTNAKNDISAEIQFLSSPFLFDKAISKLDLRLSAFSEGKILTEDLYKKSSFKIIPEKLNDSTLCDIPIFIKHDKGSKIYLEYTYFGKKIKKYGTINQLINTNQFKILIQVPDFNKFISAIEGNKVYFQFNNKKTLASKLLPSLLVSPLDPNAKTIQVSYSGHNPMLCHDIVEGITTSFFDYDEEIRTQGAKNSLLFIEKQLDSLTKEKTMANDSILYYQKINKMITPESKELDISNQNSRLKDEIKKLKADLLLIQTIEAKINNEPNRVELYKQIPDINQKNLTLTLEKNINVLLNYISKREELLYTFTEETREIKQINKRIKASLQSIRKNFNLIENVIKDNLSNLQDSIYELEKESNFFPQMKIRFAKLKSLIEVNEKYYKLFEEKKFTYAISNAGYVPSNRILSYPTNPTDPFSPNGRTIYVSFLFVGLAIGLAFLAFKYLTFNEINNVEELKNLLPEKVNILGGVPLTKQSMEFSQLVVQESPKSMLAESLRNIRSNMAFINKNAQTIVISSSISGEGKTFIALNLAGILAMSGKRTIVLDLDLRKPKVHLGFNSTNENGMSNLIVNQITLDEAIQKSKFNNLDFITAGPIPPNPSELILSKEFQNILSVLKVKYDIVIIDNPPVGLVSDGIQLLANADIPIYVFKAHYSKRISAYKVAEILEIQHIKSLNIILNGIDAKKSGYGYGYGLWIRIRIWIWIWVWVRVWKQFWLL